MRVKVIGLGGIGTWLLPPLARFLRYKQLGSELVLIDGDRYEPENAERQAFDALGAKAEVAAARIGREHPELAVRAVSEYVTEETAMRLIREGDVVLAGVDNHATRKILSDRAGELDKVVVISGGNELTTGSVQVYWREGGKDKTLPMANPYHPEIARPTDQVPGPACERQAPRQPQLLFMNAAVASAMLSAFYAWLEGKLNYDMVYIDILTNTVRPVNRREEAAGAAG